MLARIFPALALTLLVTACASTTKQSAPVDAEARKSLFSAVSALEGRWEGVAPDGSEGVTIFEVSSGGSVVRERMQVGTPHEMTNMYSLDGNDLVMTHYCAMGNQPKMRASNFEGGRVAFSFDSVSDLGADDEIYMGEMTLVIHDENRIEQQWRAFRSGEIDSEMSIEMKRVQ